MATCCSAKRGSVRFGAGGDTFRPMVASRAFGPVGELAAARHGALTRSQAAHIGFSPKVITRLLRDQVLLEPVPGVLVVAGAPATWRQRLYVATLASRGAGCGGFASAAALGRLDGYPPGPLALIVPTSRHIALPDLVVRRRILRPDEIDEVDGIPCTNIARTLCDIASIDRPQRVRMAFDSAWRQGASLTWIERTASALLGPRTPGPRLVLALAEQARSQGRPTESVLEVAVERALGSLRGLVRQYEVRRADGSFVARVDFAIPALKIAIEAHSRRHHFGTAADVHDADREAALHAEGWIVRFVTDAQRRNPRLLRSSIEQLVRARHAQVA
jgi:very-short-patch-repair endonuclease